MKRTIEFIKTLFQALFVVAGTATIAILLDIVFSLFTYI